MDAKEDWWTVAAPSAQPTGRWLGIIRRPLALGPSRPARLSIPPVLIRGSAVVSCGQQPSEPASIRAAMCVDPAHPIPSVIFTLHVSRAGSVSLAAIISEPQPSPSPAVSTTSSHADRIWNAIKMGGQAPDTPASEPPLAKRLSFILQAPASILSCPTGPLEWPAAMFPYQLDGVRALLTKDALLLADDMGLGKTIQAVAALRILFVQHRIETALVVVRAGLINQWRREIRTWSPELRISTVHGPAPERAYQWAAPAHIHLTSYETLRSDFTDNPASPPRKRTWDVVVLDEAQQIKNPNAEVSQKCKLLPRHRAWALTGTPLENRLEDLASILEFVSPLEKGDRPVQFAPDAAMLSCHQALQLRRKKRDVLLQLPPKTTSHILLPLTEAQQASYKEEEEQGIGQLRERGDEVRTEHVLALITRLKQICNACPRTGESSKLEEIRERLATLTTEGHRALVFSQFTNERHGVEYIASRLAEFNPLLYTGTLSLPFRQKVIDQFKADPAHRVLVISLRAGGQGLNLQEASYVFHFDRWWNPAVENQADGRSDRLGQTQPVHVYKYTCEGTIEERIDTILREKQLLFDETVDDVSIDLRAYLSGEELFGLFGLTPPPGAVRPARAPLPDFEQMAGTQFELYVKDLLESRGWAATVTPASHDGGIDLIASRRVDDTGADITLYVQCKNHRSPVGVDIVRQVIGALPKHHPGSRGVIVCPSGFSAEARSLASDRGIILWDRHHIFDLGG